jgi:hypothetical protein
VWKRDQKTRSKVVSMSVNRFTLLYNPEESVEQEKEQGWVNTRQRTERKCVSKKKEDKVTGVRGSHARGCVAKMTESRGKTFEVSRFVKLGASLVGISNIAREDISKLTKQDVIVVWEGTNDTWKNASRSSLQHITNFVKSSSHTNIFVMNVPHRYYWIAPSCVNSEVKVFNRKVQNKRVLLKNFRTVDVDINIEHFTQHGLHMKVSCEEKIARKISDVRKVVTRKKGNVCHPEMEGNVVESSHEESEVKEERKDSPEIKEIKL